MAIRARSRGCAHISQTEHIIRIVAATLYGSAASISESNAFFGEPEQHAIKQHNWPSENTNTRRGYYHPIYRATAVSQLIAVALFI